MRTLLHAILITALLCLSGCGELDTVDVKTQVTLRIQLQDAPLFADMTHVLISIYRKDGDNWMLADKTSRLRKDNLRWPIDIPIVPSSPAAESKPFEVRVEALSGDMRISQTRVISSYQRNSVRLLEVWLYACSGQEGGACSADGCYGPACATCTLLGECAPVTVVDPALLPVFTRNESPALKPTPGSDPQMDGGTDGDEGGVVTIRDPDASLAPPVPVTCNPPCSASAECVVSGTMASCKCASGFESKAGVCEDINECATAGGGCGANATCQNTLGGRICTCLPSFEDKRGDGSECVDKCAAAACDAHATCSVVGTEAVCTCPSPYVGGGKTCTFDQSCSLLKCDAHATCVATGTARECKCGTGYTGSGTTCTNVNECMQATNPCGANSTCQDTDGAYTCGCAAGFRRNGNVCENISDCSPNPCLNGGTCTDGINSYTCSCAGTGFEGTRCQTNTNNCTATSCMNGGTCVDGVNGFTCSCKTGYSGATCMTNANDCPATNPCQNGGTCMDGLGTYTCSCKTGYSGPTCATDTPDCPATNPCMNGGTCVDGVGSYTCTCATGFNGPLCQTNINDCASSPCRNGGTCRDLVADYSCTCPTGYTGKSCETNPNNCPANACLNGGTCVDGLNTWSCSCPSGYMGATCEQQTCGDTFITSAQTLQNARACAVIQGYLRIAGAGLSTITASDFPYLTRVTGEVSISSFAAQQSSPVLSTLTLGKLQTIGGRFQVAATTGLTTASFPELTSVGSIDSVTGGPTNWNLPKLTTVNGAVNIAIQYNLCTFNAPRVNAVAGAISLSQLPKVPASSFAPLINAARSTVTRDTVGCCFLADNAACQAGPDQFQCGC